MNAAWWDRVTTPTEDDWLTFLRAVPGCGDHTDGGDEWPSGYTHTSAIDWVKADPVCAECARRLIAAVLAQAAPRIVAAALRAMAQEFRAAAAMRRGDAVKGVLKGVWCHRAVTMAMDGDADALDYFATEAEQRVASPTGAGTERGAAPKEAE